MFDQIDTSALPNLDGLDPSYLIGKVATAELFQAATGVILAVYDFVKIDVLRGYLQVVAVFFSNIVSDALDKAKAFFGNLASIFALSFAYLSSSITPRVVFIAVLIIGFVYIVLLTFVMLSLRGTHVNRQVDGHEAMTWGQRAGLSSKKVKFYSYTLLLGIFLYLPISQAAIEVLACGGLTSRYIASEHPEACTVRTVDNQPEYDCKCSKAGGDYTSLVVAAVIALLVYTLAFPIFMLVAIHKNKPRGSLEFPDKRYDEDGELVDYTDAMYRADLAAPDQKANPFNSLYKSYERKHAYYKVVGLMMQLAITVSVVAGYGNPVAQSVVGIVIIFGWGLLAFLTAPFLSSLADISETTSRASSLLTLIFTLIAHSSGGSSALGALINIVQAVGLTVMVLCILSDLPPVRRVLRNLAPVLIFEDSVGNVVGPFDKVWFCWESFPNLRKETKHSIWHTFWTGLMMREEVSQKVKDRFVTNLSHTQDAGKDQIRDHWDLLLKGHLPLRAEIQADYEGVDAFWNNRFGKLWVRPYPFTCFHVADADANVTPVRSKDTMDFLSKQKEPAVAGSRNVRRRLRALNGQTVSLNITRMERHTIPDGWQETTDSNGNTTRTRRYATVAIEVTYTNGTGLVSNSKGLLTKHRYPASPGCGPVLSKADTLREQRAEKQTAEAPGDDESHEGDEESRQESDSNVVRVRPTEESGEVFMINTREFAHGMSFGVRSTGHGVGVGPMTGERTEVHPTTVFSGKDLGISAPAEGLWEITDVWFMEKNKQVHEAGLPQVVKHHDDYRRWLMAGRKKDQSVLTSAFWFFVFDNDQADWGFVEWYFANVESNPEVQELRPKHGEGIAAMIKRRNYVRTTPAVAFWYQVFSDVWEMNKEIKKVAQAEDVLDPAKSTALCYRPMGRSDLEAVLEEHGLLKKRGKGLFNPKLLDKLYETLEKLEEEFKKDGGEKWRAALSSTNHAGMDLDELAKLGGCV